MTNIKKVKQRLKFIEMYNNLPVIVRTTLLQMFYGHNHFMGVPGHFDEQCEFFEFTNKTLKQGLFIPD